MPKISMRELELPVGSITNSPEFENVCAAPNLVLYLSTGAAMGELRSFIAAKKIDITFISDARRICRRQELVGVLEAENISPEFQPFPDLPSELRILVYERHTADFHHPVCATSQPPIPKACSAIRRQFCPCSTILTYSDSV